MGLTRVFYGHEGSVAPLGLYAPVEDEAPLEAIVEEIELPGTRAKVAELDAFAETHGIVFADGATAKEKRAAIDEWADSLPEFVGAETEADAEVLDADDESEDAPEGDDGDDESADSEGE